AGVAVHQYPLRRSYPPHPNTLKLRAAGRLQHRRFLQRQVGRLQGQRLLRCRREFRIRTEPASGELPEDFVAGTELRDVSADRFDVTGDICADDLELRYA